MRSTTRSPFPLLNLWVWVCVWLEWSQKARVQSVLFISYPVRRVKAFDGQSLFILPKVHIHRFVYEVEPEKYKISLKVFFLRLRDISSQICREANNTKISEAVFQSRYLQCVFSFFSFPPAPPVKFDDCKGNNKLNFEVSNPGFAVELDGNLIALKNVSEVGRALFVHARSEHAEDMAEIFILEANEKRGALKVR